MSAQDAQQHQKRSNCTTSAAPPPLASEHACILETAFESFARQWATQLTANVRVKSVVTGQAISS